MKTFVNIGGQKIEATVYGYSHDTDWDGRETKVIQTVMTYEQAKSLFVDDVPWGIVQEYDPIQQADGSTITLEPVVYDNADYCMAGPITDYRDGTVSVKMGKPTDKELLDILMGEMTV